LYLHRSELRPSHQQRQDGSSQKQKTKTVTHRPARPSQLEKYGKLEPKKKKKNIISAQVFPESPFWHWSGRH
jgi:hypothetical protein